MSMDKDLLVEIFVPTESGGDEGMIATGYPVAPGRILTAGHVLEGNPDPSAIKVRWYSQEGQARKWQSINSILWQGNDGEDGLDAAVLDCTFPESVSGFGVLSAQRTQTDQRWESEGFARAGKKGKSRKPVGLKGACYSEASNVKTFGLGVDDWPDGKGQWKGASGGPVFVNGSIIGVINSCPENFSGRRLNATAIWPLLEIEEFRKAVHRETKYLNDVQESLVKVLTGSHKVMVDLGSELYIEEFGSHEDWARAIALDLSQSPCYETVKKLDPLHKKYHKSAEKENTNVIVDIVNQILPAIYNFSAVEDAIKCIENGEAILVNPLIFNPTGAEIIMAGVDERPAEFNISNDRFRFLSGVLRLPAPPESGLDPNGQQFQHAWEDFLIEQFISQKDWDLYHKDQKLAREAALKKASDELSYLAKHRKQTYYFVYDYPLRDDTVNDWYKALGKLKQSFPSLVFMNLSEETDDSQEMAFLFRILRDMFKRHYGKE